MLNNSVVLVCSGNTSILELFRSKRYFMLECIEREVTERFKRRIFTFYITKELCFFMVRDENQV